MCIIVGRKINDLRHLDDEEGRSPAALLHSAYQFMHVLHAPLRRRIREAGVAALLQRDPLDLHQVQPVGPRQAEIKPRLAKAKLRPDALGLRVEGPCKLRKRPVRCLGVHIDQSAALIHRDKIVGCPTPRRDTRHQIHLSPRYQQFTTASGVLHMADRLGAVQFHQRNEAIGAREKAALHHIFVPHSRASPAFGIEIQYSTDNSGWKVFSSKERSFPCGLCIPSMNQKIF